MHKTFSGSRYVLMKSDVSHISIPPASAAVCYHQAIFCRRVECVSVINLMQFHTSLRLPQQLSRFPATRHHASAPTWHPSVTSLAAIWTTTAHAYLRTFYSNKPSFWLQIHSTHAAFQLLLAHCLVLLLSNYFNELRLPKHLCIFLPIIATVK